MKKYSLFFLAVLCVGLLAGCTAYAPTVPPAPAENHTQPGSSSAQESLSDTENFSAQQPEPVENTPPVTPPPDADPVEESLTALRRMAADQDALCAAAYLGYAGPAGDIVGFLAADSMAEQLQAYPFLAAIPPKACIQQPGGEVYCIVPAAGASVTVHVYTQEGITPPLEKGQTTLLYAGDDTPLLLMGNESDILPNLQVTVCAADGSAVTFAPTLSLKDGSFYPMGAAAGVFDFSSYS